MNTTTPSTSSDTIPARAYRLWEAAGRPDGRDQEFWFRAERELKVTHNAPSSPAATGNGAPRPRPVRERRVAR